MYKDSYMDFFTSDNVPGKKYLWIGHSFPTVDYNTVSASQVSSHSSDQSSFKTIKSEVTSLFWLRRGKLHFEITVVYKQKLVKHFESNAQALQRICIVFEIYKNIIKVSSKP